MLNRNLFCMLRFQIHTRRREPAVRSKGALSPLGGPAGQPCHPRLSPCFTLCQNASQATQRNGHWKLPDFQSSYFPIVLPFQGLAILRRGPGRAVLAAFIFKQEAPHQRGGAAVLTGPGSGIHGGSGIYAQPGRTLSCRFAVTRVASPIPPRQAGSDRGEHAPEPSARFHCSAPGGHGRGTSSSHPGPHTLLSKGPSHTLAPSLNALCLDLSVATSRLSDWGRAQPCQPPKNTSGPAGTAHPPRAPGTGAHAARLQVLVQPWATHTTWPAAWGGLSAHAVPCLASHLWQLLPFSTHLPAPRCFSDCLGESLHPIVSPGRLV